MPGTVLGTGDSKILAFRELKSKVGVGEGLKELRINNMNRPTK